MHVIPATKDAIITALGTRPNLNAIPKLYAPPTEQGDVEWGGFWFEEEVPGDSNWAQLGAGRRRIEFRIPFVVMAVTESDDPRTTDRTAWGYFEEIEAALRASPSFSGLIQQFDMVATKNRVVPTGPQKWEASITGQVVCTSRSY